MKISFFCIAVALILVLRAIFLVLLILVLGPPPPVLVLVSCYWFCCCCRRCRFQSSPKNLHANKPPSNLVFANKNKKRFFS